MNLLFIGDIFGSPGRLAVKRALPALRRELEIDFVVANCENCAGGKGVTESLAKDLFNAGCDVLTGGNHSFHQKDSHPLFDSEPRLLRPANYPEGTPGRGAGVFESAAGFSVGVMNICGRAFMSHYDDPWRCARRLVADLRKKTPIILLDFHAEATSEKQAMGWYLDGSVTAVIGTHTHVPTADERLLAKGTAFITDAGMTGPHDSVIGDDKEIILDALLTLLPHRFEVAAPRDVRINAVLVKLDPLTGAATGIERVRRDLGDFETK